MATAKNPASQSGTAQKKPVVDVSCLIEPTGVYSEAAVRRMLGLKESTLKTARREEGLACVRRSKLTYYLGADLLDWLRRGRIPGKGEGAVQVAASPSLTEEARDGD